MRKLGLLLAAVIPLSGLLRTSGAVADTGQPDYVDQNGDWMLSSGALWDSARVVAPNLQYCLGWLADRNCQVKSPTIWAASCSRSAQTVVFKRTVTLPGAPSQARFSWAGFGVANRVFPWIDDINVLVNGTSILHLTPNEPGPTVNSTSFIPPPAAFAYGENTVEVAVSKSPDPSRRWRCAKLLPGFGVAFALEGEAVARLALMGATNGRQLYTTSRALTASGTITVRNDGPAPSIGTGLLLDVLLDNGAVISAPQVSASRGSCRLSGQLAGHLQYSCDFGTVAPGDSASLSFAQPMIAVTGNEKTLANRLAWEAWNSDFWYPGYYAEPQWVVINMCGQQSVEPDCAVAPQTDTVQL